MAEASAPSPRVIQMIDENKEQLRNLFRNYNVLDVQPAISVRPPDDMSALQVPLVTPPPQAPCCPGCSHPLRPSPAPLDGDHCPGHSPLPGCHALHPHELVLQDCVSDPYCPALRQADRGQSRRQAGPLGPKVPVQPQPPSPAPLLLSRHKRKLKDIVAGSAGKRGL